MFDYVSIEKSSSTSSCSSPSLNKGKALLTIERFDSKYCRFDVHARVFTASAGLYDDEAFSCLGISLPLPDVALKLKVGQRITVAVTYSFYYSCDYFGEWDIDVEYHRQKVLWRSKKISRKRRLYTSKKQG